MNGSLPHLGRRGEGWVALQVVLLAAITAAGIRGSRWPSLARSVRTCAAAASALGGLYLFAGGIERLGEQITPFPKPVEDGSVKRSGAYGLVRHPMYGGVLLLALGWSLASSPLALAPWPVAAIFLDAKRRRAEAWLVEAHPDYEEYRASVHHNSSVNRFPLGFVELHNSASRILPCRDLPTRAKRQEDDERSGRRPGSGSRPGAGRTL